MEINSVTGIFATAEQGVYAVECEYTNDVGVAELARHSYRSNDPYGLSPLIKAWLEENPDFPIDPYVPPEPPTPEEVRAHMPPLSARQLRLGLLAAGISPSQVSATIGEMPAGPDKDKAQIEWEYATTFNRMYPLVATVGAALGLTETQIDDMWLAALSL